MIGAYTIADFQRIGIVTRSAGVIKHAFLNAVIIHLKPVSVVRTSYMRPEIKRCGTTGSKLAAKAGTVASVTGNDVHYERVGSEYAAKRYSVH